MSAKKRTEVENEDKWNVEALFKDENAWKEAFKKASSIQDKPRFPQIASFKGKLESSPETLKTHSM